MGGPSIIPGGRIEKASPVPVSNVMVICPTCKQPTRIGTHLRTVKDKTIRVRVCRNPTAARRSTSNGYDETYIPRVKERYERELRPA